MTPGGGSRQLPRVQWPFRAESARNFLAGASFRKMKCPQTSRGNEGCLGASPAARTRCEHGGVRESPPGRWARGGPHLAVRRSQHDAGALRSLRGRPFAPACPGRGAATRGPPGAGFRAGIFRTCICTPARAGPRALPAPCCPLCPGRLDPPALGAGAGAGWQGGHVPGAHACARCPPALPCSSPAGTEMPSPLVRCMDLLVMPGAALCQCHLHGTGTGDLGAHRASSCTAGHGKHCSCWAHSASRCPSQLQIRARFPVPITQLQLPAPALVSALCPSARWRRSALPAACCPQRHLLTVIESSLSHFFPISQTHRALRP